MATDYEVAFVDDDGQILSKSCLYTDEAECGCGTGPRGMITIRQAVPFPDGAYGMRLLRCHEPVEEWPIPDPPKVDVVVDCPDDEYGDEDVTIRWKVRGKKPENDEETAARRPRDGYWALVQWRDHRGTWRGCAPRTQEREVTVARSALGAGTDVHIRVLVTSGIATGVGEWEGLCGQVQVPEGPGLVLTQPPGEGPRTEVAATLKLSRVGSSTGQRGAIRWHGPDGGELGRGRTLDLRVLPVGQTAVTAVVVGGSDPVTPRQWLVERTADDRFFLLQGDQRPPDPCGPEDEPDDGGHRHPAGGGHDKRGEGEQKQSGYDDGDGKDD